MKHSENTHFLYRKQGRFAMTEELDIEDLKRFRELTGESKSLWYYCVHLHDPRKPLPPPAGYCRISGCPPSSASVAYRELRELGYILFGYEEGVFFHFVNPGIVWRGSERSRIIQKNRIERAIEAAKAQEAGLNARQRK